MSKSSNRNVVEWLHRNEEFSRHRQAGTDKEEWDSKKKPVFKVIKNYENLQDIWWNGEKVYRRSPPESKYTNEKKEKFIKEEDYTTDISNQLSESSGSDESNSYPEVLNILF